MTESWILKAIEDAAMARAWADIARIERDQIMDANFRLFGLTKEQILALSQFFLRATGGRNPQELTPEEIRSSGIKP